MMNKDMFGRQAKEARNILGDYPIIEATADILVYVNKQDGENAVRGDAHKCVFANACKRAFGSRGVLFYPTVAYIDMPDEDGNHVIYRTMLPKKTRDAIEAFDRHDEKREGTFRLKAVPKGQTLKAQRVKQRTRDKTNIDPVRSEATKKAWQTRKKSKLMGTRTGTGKIYHSPYDEPYNG